MSIHIESKIENIARERWNSLVSKSATNTVFQTYEWHIAWWEAFKENKELYMVCASEGEEITAIAPLFISTGEKKRLLKFIGAERSDYSDFIYARDDNKTLCSILEFMVSRRSDWDQAELYNIPSVSASSAHLSAICEKEKLFCLPYACSKAPALALNKKEDVEKIVSRKKTKYFLRQLQKKTGYRVRHLKNENEILGLLDTFFVQHIERWKAKGEKSLFLDERNQLFYRKLLSYLCGNGWVLFSVMEVEGAPIAFNFGFEYDKTYALYKPTFAISLGKYSPGQVMDREIVKYALKQKFDEVDFLMGEEEYKIRCANKMRKIVSYKIIKGRRTFILEKTAAALKKKIKKLKYSERLISFFSYVKNKIC